MFNLYTITQSDALYLKSLNQHMVILRMQIHKNELNFMLCNITKIEIILILKSAIEFCLEIFQNAEFVTVETILLSSSNYRPFQVPKNP